MHFHTTTILAAASLITSSFSMPLADRNLNERNLCTVKPTILKYLSKSGPLTRITSTLGKHGGSAQIPLGPQEWIIEHSPSQGVNSTREVRTALKFVLPAGAHGCRLHSSGPPTRIFTQYGQIDTSVYRVTDVTEANDWTNQPLPLPSQPGLVAQQNWLGDETNLWAGECDTNLSFLFKYSDWQTQGGKLHFLQAFDGNDSKDGFTIQYDC